MTDDSFDPIGEWQKLVTQMERQINDISREFALKEEFSRSMNQATQMSVFAQRAFDDYLEKLLVTAHLPTQSQMKQLTEQIDRIEDKLDQLLRALSPPSPAPKPPRTRRPAQAE